MSYTDFVQGVIGNISGTVGWDINSVQLVVDDMLIAYPADSEAEASDTTKAYALLRYYTWSRIRDEFILDFDYKSDGESFSRSQIVEQLERKIAEARVAASAYLPANQITVTNLDVGYTPYLRSS